VDEVEDFFNQFVIKFFGCGNYDHDAPASSSYPRPLVYSKQAEQTFSFKENLHRVFRKNPNNASMRI
jgi:hypothetical protein